MPLTFHCAPQMKFAVAIATSSRVSGGREASTHDTGVVCTVLQQQCRGSMSKAEAVDIDMPIVTRSQQHLAVGAKVKIADSIRNG